MFLIFSKNSEIRSILRTIEITINLIDRKGKSISRTEKYFQETSKFFFLIYNSRTILKMRKIFKFKVQSIRSHRQLTKGLG